MEDAGIFIEGHEAVKAFHPNDVQSIVQRRISVASAQAAGNDLAFGNFQILISLRSFNIAV